VYLPPGVRRCYFKTRYTTATTDRSFIIIQTRFNHIKIQPYCMARENDDDDEDCITIAQVHGRIPYTPSLRPVTKLGLSMKNRAMCCVRHTVQRRHGIAATTYVGHLRSLPRRRRCLYQQNASGGSDPIAASSTAVCTVCVGLYGAAVPALT
jgi:hypothetical protein